VYIFKCAKSKIPRKSCEKCLTGGGGGGGGGGYSGFNHFSGLGLWKSAKEKNMAISTAKQSGNTVYVYDERGSVLFQRSGTLMGYTSTTVTVKNGTTNYTYNDKGGVMFQR